MTFFLASFCLPLPVYNLSFLGKCCLLLLRCAFHAGMMHSKLEAVLSLFISLRTTTRSTPFFHFLIAPLHKTTPCLSIHLQGESPPPLNYHCTVTLITSDAAKCFIRPVQSLCFVVRSVRPPRRGVTPLVVHSFVRSRGCHLAEALPLLRVIRLQSKDPPTHPQSQSVSRTDGRTDTTQQQQHLRLPCPFTGGNFNPWKELSSYIYPHR